MLDLRNLLDIAWQNKYTRYKIKLDSVIVPPCDAFTSNFNTNQMYINLYPAVFLSGLNFTSLQYNDVGFNLRQLIGDRYSQISSSQGGNSFNFVGTVNPPYISYSNYTAASSVYTPGESCTSKNICDIWNEFTTIQSNLTNFEIALTDTAGQSLKNSGRLLYYPNLTFIFKVRPCL
jgi:hypothetical protein